MRPHIEIKQNAKSLRCSETWDVYLNGRVVITAESYQVASDIAEGLRGVGDVTSEAQEVADTIRCASPVNREGKIMTKKSFIGFQVLNEDGYPATSGTLEDDRESAIFTNIDGAQRWIRWLKEEVGSTDNFTVRRVDVKVLEEDV